MEGCRLQCKIELLYAPSKVEIHDSRLEKPDNLGALSQWLYL